MTPELLSAPDVEARLSSLQLPPDSGENPGIWPYREAAAVLAQFDPFRLRVSSPALPRHQALDLLRRDVVESFESGGKLLWALRPEVRRAALKHLGSPERIQEAIKLNSKPGEDAFHHMLEDAIRGHLRPFDTYQREKLARLLVVCEWLHGILRGVPHPDRVRQEIRVRTLMDPFEVLTSNFQGRRKELQQLQTYLFSGSEDPFPLLGLGGSGKSSLIAKFIKEQTRRKPPLHFAYLDFDRPQIVASQPNTLLIEALEQIGIQKNNSDLASTASDLRHVSEELNAESYSDAGSFIAPDSELRSGAETYIDTFIGTLKRAEIFRGPMLLVLDTFEEVQYQGSQVALSLLNFSRELIQRSGQAIRVVIASRSPIRGSREEGIELGDLDREAALGFLASHGVKSAPLAQRIVSRLGGNPLTLRLAAELLSRKRGTVRESLQVAAAEQEVIQGQLYRRILQHVHDVRIRKLAHPGLVLRRITPEIIKKVLAGPCIVAVRSAQDAEELFAKFRDEVSLVTQADDGSLHHRADVRKVMLRFLLQDDPARVSRIHDSAIAYYMKQHDVISRAEEIYHRLAQGQDAKLIEARWIDGIESYLKNSIDELPVESQRFLASRLEIELAPEIWSSASQTEQERVIANQATALLEAGRAAAVTEFLSSRSEVTSKSASLTLLEGQAYAALKKTQRAIRAGKKALSLAELNNDRDLRLRAASFLAACYDDTLNPRQARKYYHQAFELANTLKEPIRALEIALSEAVTINEWDKEYQQLTATISNLVMSIEPERLMTQKQLVFDVAASFGHAEPELLRTIVTRYRLPAGNEKRLAAVLSKWDRELGRNLKQSWPMAGARDIPNANGWKSPWPKYVASLGTQRTVDMIRSLAERFPIPRAAARAFSALFKSRLGTEALRMTSKVKSKKLKKLLARRKSSVRRRSIGRLKSARKKTRKK